MELLLKIAAASAMALMLFYLWPVFRHWQEHGPKARTGDWQAAILPLVAVILLVVMLITAVR